MDADLDGVRRVPYETALRASTTHRHDYLNSYVDDLVNVVDMDAIRASGLRLGVDPLGGAGVHYWPAIAERYEIDLTIVNDAVDQTFRFMTVDWDGRIRMDPSSPYAMQRLVGLKDSFDIAFACDTDHDRHGIVCRSVGLIPPNDYLAVSIDHLFRHRPQWRADVSVGKSVVCSSMLDRVSAQARTASGTRCPSASSGSPRGSRAASWVSAARRARARHSCVATAKRGRRTRTASSLRCCRRRSPRCAGRDPGEIYAELTRELGTPVYGRVEAHASPAQKKLLGAMSPAQVKRDTLGGEKIDSIITNAPGNGAPIGGVKVSTENGWFAARPSGTEDIYKIYGESFRGKDQLDQLLAEAQTIVDAVLAGADSRDDEGRST